MATFPGGVYNPRTKENKTGVVYNAAKTKIGYAEDVVKLDDEVVAIETELGTNPKGIYESVKANLIALWVAISNAVDDFLDLSDTPNSYSGQAGKIVAVNDGENAVEFVEPAAGAWKVLADVTLEAQASYIDSGALSDYKFLKFILHIPRCSATASFGMRVNGLSTAIYGTDALYGVILFQNTGVSTIALSANRNITSIDQQFYFGEISNFSDNGKMLSWLGSSEGIAAGVGYSFRGSGQINLTSLITSLRFLPSTGNLYAGTRLIVLGLNL